MTTRTTDTGEPSSAHRPDCARRRTDYTPRSPQEEFGSPLILHNIEETFRLHCTNVAPGSRALDAGCGRQPFRGKLEALGYAYTGMDVVQSPENSVDVVAPLDGELPQALVERGPFQFILCTEVMEHVADWNAAMANLFAVTAPGGKVLITCPFFYVLHEEPFDYWRPTYHALKHRAEAAGFRMISYAESGDGWDILGTLLAHCNVSAPTRSFADRAVSKLCRVAKNALVRLLISRRLQRHARLRGRIYMSNAVVLERPA